MSAPETYVDVSTELLELLLLKGLGVSIVGVRTAGEGVVRLYIEGADLPPGPMEVVIRDVAASRTLELRPA